MSTPTDVYLSNEVYARLKAALAALVAQPFEREGTDPETEVVAALGEVGGIWPEFVTTGADLDD